MAACESGSRRIAGRERIMTSRGWQVLVADDDPTVALLMRAALSAPEFVLTLVNDGAAAWEEFRHSTFDLVLLDVEMPEMDGLAVCEAIRASQQSQVPVVLITGHDEPAFVERAKALRADYMVKPVDWSSLAARLREILSAAKP